MIANGTMVVIMPTIRYYGHYNGFVGMVCAVRAYDSRSCEYGIKLYDATKNTNSTGLYWFREEDLSIVLEKTTIGNSLNIKKIIFNNPKTIVLWGDGTKTIVSCGDGDIFDPYAGFCAAVTKKIFGSTSKVKKIIDTYSKGK